MEIYKSAEQDTESWDKELLSASWIHADYDKSYKRRAGGPLGPLYFVCVDVEIRREKM